MTLDPTPVPGNTPTKIYIQHQIHPPKFFLPPYNIYLLCCKSVEADAGLEEGVNFFSFVFFQKQQQRSEKLVRSEGISATVFSQVARNETTTQLQLPRDRRAFFRRALSAGGRESDGGRGERIVLYIITEKNTRSCRGCFFCSSFFFSSSPSFHILSACSESSVLHGIGPRDAFSSVSFGLPRGLLTADVLCTCSSAFNYVMAAVSTNSR